jgi:hypothetical protein
VEGCDTATRVVKSGAMVEKLADHEGVSRPDLVAKLNELIDSVNLLGEAISIVWGDVPKPDGWKWE